MPKTLLLADDSVVIQKLVGLSFANEDVDLVTTDNGDDAIIRARELRPDLVLADVVMPGKNGYEVCQAIKSDPDLAGTPVLLLTGTFEAFDEDRARAVGSDGHITKPFEAQGLVDRVTDLLSQARPAPAPAAAAMAAPVDTAPDVGLSMGSDASPEMPVSAPSASAGEDAYDFFDDEVPELATPEPAAAAPAPPAAPTNDAFAFGEDLDPFTTTEPVGRGADTLDTNFELDSQGPDDRTVVVSPDTAPSPIAPPPLPVGSSPPNAPEATRVDLGERMIPDDRDLVPASMDPLSETPAVPVEDPAQAMLADDLFADTTSAGPAPAAALAPPPIPEPLAAPASSMPPVPDSAFEFGFDDPAATPAEDVAPAPTAQTSAAEPIAIADLGVDTGMGRDDSADPLAGMSQDPPMGSRSADDPEAPALADVAESTHSGYDVSMSDLDDSPTATDLGISAPQPAASGPGQPRPDVSPVMRDRIHETLEKVAWEAFADVSDSIVRQVMQRVESIVWEVVPQMAETLIQEEIRRMKGDD